VSREKVREKAGGRCSWRWRFESKSVRRCRPNSADEGRASRYDCRPSEKQSSRIFAAAHGSTLRFYPPGTGLSRLALAALLGGLPPKMSDHCLQGNEMGHPNDHGLGSLLTPADLKLRCTRLVAHGPID
jgi:hypothetical protein